MRIGIFSECYLPTINGVVISIETFRKELEKRGHEVFIIAPETEGYKDKNKKVFRFPSFVSPIQKDYPLAWPPVFSQNLIKKIKELDLDIIHCQHLFTIGRLGLKIGRRLNIPVVYTYHTLIAEYTHYVPLVSDLAKSSIIALSRNFCNACDQIVTPSPSMKKILIKYGVKTPIEPIPTGIKIEEFKKPFPKKLLRSVWKIPDHQKILLYVSRVAKEKNVDFLLKAMRDLVKKRRNKLGDHKCDIHLLMVGGGPELNHCKELAQKFEIESYITFTDMVPKEKVNKYYGAADIFVYPSYTETQGIVVAESMAAGIPAVAIDKMGPSDIIKHGVDGYLCDLNLKQFTGKIEKLLDNDDLRKRLGRNAEENAKIYSSENCAIKMEQIYEDTIYQYNQNRARSGAFKTYPKSR